MAVAEGAVVGGSATGSGGSATVAGTEPDVPGVTKGAEPAGAERAVRQPSLARNDVFGVLSNRRRRMVFEYLRDHGGGVDLSEVSE